MFASLAAKFRACNPILDLRNQTVAHEVSPVTSTSAGLNKPSKSESSPTKPKEICEPSIPPISSPAPQSFGILGQDKQKTSKSCDMVEKKDVSLENEEKRDGSIVLGGVFSSLPSASTNTLFGGVGVASAPTSTPQENQKDYHKLLTDFYQKHNPTKVAEVSQTLRKYKGKEGEMFKKLAQKYKTDNPLDEISQIEPSSFGGLGSNPIKSPSPFATTPTTPAATPFGSSAGEATPFGGALSSTKTAFGSTSATSSTPFGGTSSHSTAFGNTPARNVGFGSPFGQGAAPSTPFTSTIAPAPTPGTKFNGRTPRDLLVSFYQSQNPAKLGEVDKNLAKYAGREELLFLNLAKKYNIDPAQFGVSASQTGTLSSTPGFGSPTPAFGTPSFGSPAALGGSAPGSFGSTAGGFGSGSKGTVFGSTGGFSGGGSTFGGLAASGGTAPFGGTSTPFGAARR